MKSWANWFTQALSGFWMLVAAAVPAHSQTASIWNHNGSIVRLEASDTKRSIYYVEPRAGLPAKAGDLLFEGQRKGRSYEGTAFLFSQACGKIGYSVTGSIAEDDRTVSMTGTAPRRNAQCQITSYFQDRLVFSFLRIENNASENVETKKTVTGAESSASRQVAPAITMQAAPPIPIEHTEYQKTNQNGWAITIQNEGIFVAAFCMLLVLGVAFWVGRRLSAKAGSHHQNESSSTLDTPNLQYREKHENKDNGSKMEKNEFQSVDVNEHGRDGPKDNAFKVDVSYASAYVSKGQIAFDKSSEQIAEGEASKQFGLKKASIRLGIIGGGAVLICGVGFLLLGSADADCESSSVQNKFLSMIRDLDFLAQSPFGNKLDEKSRYYFNEFRSYLFAQHPDSEVRYGPYVVNGGDVERATRKQNEILQSARFKFTEVRTTFRDEKLKVVQCAAKILGESDWGSGWQSINYQVQNSSTGVVLSLKFCFNNGTCQFTPQ